jgi:hypothetical protein
MAKGRYGQAGKVPPPCPCFPPRAAAAVWRAYLLTRVLGYEDNLCLATARRLGITVNEVRYVLDHKPARGCYASDP